jgi:hypothetical protein
LKPKYRQLFEAVWKGDIPTIEKLTIKEKLTQQVHIASCSSYTQRSPLHIAVERNLPDVAKRLIEIAIEQYTPLEIPTKDDKKTPAINNYELSNLMESIKVNLDLFLLIFQPGFWLDTKGLSVFQERKAVDPNTPVKQINCVTSPSTILKFRSNC